MNPDLQHLIHLQDLELNAERVRHRIADLPHAEAALDERLAQQTAVVEAVKARLAANQAARREIERDLSTVQARLSKFKDQLMEVKTNKEYQAMQTEIGVAEQNVRSQEDRLLDRMEEAEALAAEGKDAERALKLEQSEVVRQKEMLAVERIALEEELRQTEAGRTSVSSELSAGALALFQHISKNRRGIAVSEARDGHCSQCHVRLRPQVFNEVRRNDSLIQCESCSRILYFIQAPAQSTASQTS